MNRRRREVFTLVVVFAVVVLLSALVVYFVSGGRRPTPDVTRQADAVLQRPGEVPSTAPQTAANDNFIDRLFGTQHTEPHLTGDSWLDVMGRIALRLLLFFFKQKAAYDITR